MSNTIALVDDDRNILTSVSMALEAEDFVVKTYKDGEEALLGIFQTPTFGTQQSHSKNMHNSYVHKFRVAARKILHQNKRAGKILFFHVYSKQ